jgi:RNA polymerase sigma factor (sigma-70 family)
MTMQRNILFFWATTVNFISINILATQAPMTNHSLTTPQLAEYCQAEAERYQQTGQSNEEYCLELFRRALTMRDQAAWEAIYRQYHPLVTQWAYRCPGFDQTGEDAAFFVNAAFSRLWTWQRGDTFKFEGLAKCLAYLKICLFSEIKDYLRKQKRDLLKAAVEIEEDIPSTTPGDNLEDQAEYNLRLIELRQILAEIVQDEQERLVAESSWDYDLSPRQIYARYPEIFSSVAEVSQVKHNLLKRLRRHPKLKDWVNQWAKK